MLEKKYNDNWLFWEEKDAFALIWSVPDHAEEITLPHDAMISKESEAESLNKGNTGFRDGGVYCYLNYMEVDESKKGKRMLMKFEGIYMNAFVYINGELAAKRPFGYSTFYVELDRYIKYGEKNEIRIFVRNGAMTNSRWYSGSGIYRDVYLLEGDRCHIEEDGLRINTEYAHFSHAMVNISSNLNNKRAESTSVSLKTVILDANDNAVAEKVSPVKLYEGEVRKVSARIAVPEPKLWDDQSPNLYRCVATLTEDDQIIDMSETTFGIRTMSLDAINGLQINSKTVKLRGVCIHHDSGILGAATYDEVQYRQIRKLKEAGVNAIRMAHNPMAQSMLRACDELGMYVMDESFDMWSRCKSDYDYAMNFEEWWERDVEAMVAKDFNHASVIMYSTGNEIPELGNRYGVQLSHLLSEKIKSLDTTRYTLTSVNGVFATGDHTDEIVKDVSAELVAEGTLEGNVNNFMALMADHMDRIVNHPRITEMLEHVSVTSDITGYNYMSSRYENDHKAYPNRIVVGSETYPPAIGNEWQRIQKLPNVIGDFSWTGWDYIGEAGVGVPGYSFGEGGFTAQFPCQLAYCGDFDLIGNRRPASYFREIAYGIRKEPYMVVVNPFKDQNKLMKTPWIISDSLSSWNYDLEQGTEVTVEIYAPGDEVEIFIDEDSYGKVPSGPAADYLSRIQLPYRKGTLTAVVYENGEEISRSQLQSYDEKRCMDLSYETIGDKAFVELTVTDGKGCRVIGEDDEVRIEVTGAELMGFGSGDPKPDYGYVGDIVKTYEGSALAILGAIQTMKESTVKVISEKYGETSLVLLGNRL